ncbi:unnamed protein product [Blepharisma stoltei]|uniref:Dipeptidyl peptidase 3 n=1 Tax=Blepharisma stoltei TaxID=1481888 RepID=A0AAU9K6P4_9CILI|nr:unnamed protein product [Blepharisma stoltei]
MASRFIHIESPVQLLDCLKAWNKLTLKEKFYAHYYSKACWEGSKICYFQKSYESPGIFLLLQEIFSVPNISQKYEEAGFTELDIKQFKAYAAGIYTNCGNYLSFGDTKIVPEISQEKLDALVSSVNSDRVAYIWNLIKNVVYDYSPSRRQLGFPDKGGVTSYYSSNITSQDAELAKNFLQSVNLVDLHFNSRLWKVGDQYEIRVASKSQHWFENLGEYTYESKRFKIVNGDFSVFLARVVDNLADTLPYCANVTQEKMISEYIKHFNTGNIVDHKNAQREWIKDKGPVVETNIGFIETYVDPLQIRAEFEGFVSFVDKETSEKFHNLVNNADSIIAKLPWSNVFEKEKFQAPDFTSLEVLAFATSGVPIGINLPNYDEIITNEGFKNVNLGNAYPKPKAKNLQFLTPEDVQLIIDCYFNSETIAVATHELLGHGTGKFLIKGKDNTFNFDTNAINPATGAVIDSFYSHEESWKSKFGEISSAYEECRAETVAVYLSCFPEVYQIFGVEDFIRHRNMTWLYMAYQGVKGLLYCPESNKWGQAHCCARYMIFRVMLEAGDDFLKVEFTDDGLFLVKMDYNKIESVGMAAISRFLTKLHCFKFSGDVVRGKEVFDKYSAIDELANRLRQIIVANQKPRALDVQCNVNLEGNEPVLVGYEESFDGIIDSFKERFPVYDEEMFACWDSEFSSNKS